MTQSNQSIDKHTANDKKAIWFVLIFLFVSVAGLLYAKWLPYYHKMITASNTHSIGDSILGSQLGGTPSWHTAWDYAVTYFQAVWKAALLGILLGSLIQVLLPTRWLLKVLGKTSFGSTAVGGLASVPGMMCTCCAAPMAVGLRKKNVSVGAALAFWIGNPAINPATLVFMTFVLSWKFTLIRLVFGLILTFGVSYFANRFAGDTKQVDVDKLVTDEEETTGDFFTKWMKSLGTMILYIVPAYILSVLVLGVARVWLFPQLSGTMANGMLSIILFAIGGMLFVIPTAAEIPIIQTFLSIGIGTGPAAALLLTLPAISLPSLIMVSKSFPKKVLLFVAVSVVVIGIISGLVGMIFL